MMPDPPGYPPHTMASVPVHTALAAAVAFDLLFTLRTLRRVVPSVIG